MIGLPICWDKIFINSELGGEENDYFMVPRVMLAMKLFGLDKATIDKVCYQNPKDFFKLHME